MNLEKLFETQKVLRERINYQGDDRFNKLVLALLVELGECANEWRGFKFWSKDQEPRKEIVVCSVCEQWLSDKAESCETCDYIGAPNEPVKKRPLLEEYVDGLHFIMELCIEVNVNHVHVESYIREQKKVIGEIEEHIGYLYNRVSALMETTGIQTKFKLLQIFNAYVGLGHRLGFTWKEIEQAYYDKNKVNHTRQDEGY